MNLLTKVVADLCQAERQRHKWWYHCQCQGYKGETFQELRTCDRLQPPIKLESHSSPHSRDSWWAMYWTIKAVQVTHRWIRHSQTLLDTMQTHAMVSFDFKRFSFLFSSNNDEKCVVTVHLCYWCRILVAEPRRNQFAISGKRRKRWRSSRQ